MPIESRDIVSAEFGENLKIETAIAVVIILLILIDVYRPSTFLAEFVIMLGGFTHVSAFTWSSRVYLIRFDHKGVCGQRNAFM